ncbi:MAG: hypothetical protein C5B60_04090 [Chloroflexi bacterium]|nr:MAG: hypothetical protein C5B60_04090 [Chloroflexota bacterium]
MNLHDLSKPSSGDLPRKRKKPKGSGRRRGTPNKRTIARQARAEIEWAERTGTKLAVTRLAEALDIFAQLMDYYRPTFTIDKKGKRRLRNGHRDEFNEAAQMVIKIGTELAPYESPRLNAVALAAPGTPAVKAAERQRVRIDINIFDDKGDLLQHAIQDGVKYDELPLLDHDNRPVDGDEAAEAVRQTAGGDVRSQAD